MTQAQDARNSLLNWRKGPIAAEEMIGGILMLDRYTEVEPINQQGGPDGGRDLRCKLRGRRHVCACYFPPTAAQIEFPDVRKKFLSDLPGVRKDNARSFIFATNTTIADERRSELRKAALAKRCTRVIFYTLDELSLILNDPRGVGLRELHLGISPSLAEGVAMMAKMQKDILETVLQQARPPRSARRNARGRRA